MGTAITTVMASLTTGTVMLITATTMARGPLMLSPKLMPTMVLTVMALPTTGTVMAWLTTGTTVLMLTLMLTDTTTARGPLMLSPLLMLTTVITTVMPHTVMLTAATTATL